MEVSIDVPLGWRVDGQPGSFGVQTDRLPSASAPTPFHLFLAAIGTCAGIYVLGLSEVAVDPAPHPIEALR
jgi:ribosomal protein S12 methylthiotransferase accessory factor